VTAMLKATLDRARSWFEALSPREQALIGLAAVLALATLFSTLVWRPLADWRQASLDELHRADLVLARIGPMGGRSLLVRAASSNGDLAGEAAAAGLQVSTLDPEGGNVRLRLEDAPFSKLIPWIDGLERQGSRRVMTARLERGSAAGLVNADLLVSGDAP